MTAHEITLLDEKIGELNKKIEALVKLQEQLKALERKGSREQAFFAGRRSMAYELRESGGLSSGRLGLEILYLLPDDFVQFYGALFHRSLSVGDGSVMHGRSGGVDKAKGNSGTVLGSDTRLQASGSGKKYKNTPLMIGNEDMLKLKQRLDGRLVQLQREFAEYMGIGLQGSSRDVGQSQALGGEAQVSRTSMPVTIQCRNTRCRSFLKREWDYCPRCGTGLVDNQGGFGPGKDSEVSGSG